ncbi:MAG: M20/M25/M40 family metallo-hydrolase [Candidatus Limnocylindria bacterium]
MHPSPRRGRTSAIVLITVAVAVAACGAPPSTPTFAPTTEPTAWVEGPAGAPPSTAAPSPTASLLPSPKLARRDLRDAVEAIDIRGHLEELQRIADAHDGNRATGTSGFDASVEFVADQLSAAGYKVIRQDFAVGELSSVNLLAERTGADSEVVMFGAHLDSVAAGPGINDNGSGVATLLVIAERLAELPAPGRTVRFAFWGAEEGGPHGSQVYVDALEAAERGRIVGSLNFDMLGSPNAIRFVYDESGAAPGSAALTELFTTAFEDAGLAWEPIDLEGDSDHGPFTDAGIPTGGLFSGGIEPKTDSQATTFGGNAGEPADACSHRACDRIDNVNLGALEQMADAIAHVLVMIATDPT